MLRALTATGGVITSAGILLAAVFAVLGVLPLVVLAQLGTIICIGVLLDTLVVRTRAGPGPRAAARRHVLVAAQGQTRRAPKVRNCSRLTRISSENMSNGCNCGVTCTLRRGGSGR